MVHNRLEMVSLTKPLLGTYVDIGTTAYKQHYRHLWQNGNCTPYISCNFAKEVLYKELQDLNTELFLIKNGSAMVGIAKLDLDASLGPFTEKEALLLDKIYLLKAHSGMGIGTKVLDFSESRARQLGKTILWLDTMKNGPALPFYLKNGFEIYDSTALPFSESIETERAMYISIKKL